MSDRHELFVRNYRTHVGFEEDSIPRELLDGVDPEVETMSEHEYAIADFVDYTAPKELISGADAVFTAIVDNVGDGAFPGGSLTDVRFSQPTGGREVVRRIGDVPVPELDRDGTTRLSVEVGAPVVAGAAWIQFAARADDDRPVTLVDVEGREAEDGAFEQVLRVVDRERLRVLKQLHDPNAGPRASAGEPE